MMAASAPRRLRHNAFIVLAGLAGARLTQMAAHLALARLGGPEVYGLFALCNTLVVTVGHLALAGLQHALVRFGGPVFARGGRDGLSHLFRVILVRGAALSLVVTAVSLAFTALCAERLFDDRDLQRMLQPMVLSLPCLTVVTLCTYSLRTLERYWLDTLVRNVLRGVLLLFGMFAVSWQYSLRDARTVGLIFTVTFAITMVVALAAVSPLLRSTPHVELPPRNEIWKYAWTLTGGIFLYEAMLGTDKVLIGALSTKTELGHYSVASLLARQMELLALVTHTILSPRFAAAAADPSKQAEIPRLIRRASVLNAALATLLLACLMATSKLILSIAGHEYTGEIPQILVLGVAYILMSTATPSGTLLQFYGNPLPDTVLYGIALAVNAVLGLALVSLFGSLGAALAMLVAMALVAVGRIVLGQRLLKTRLVVAQT